MPVYMTKNIGSMLGVMTDKILEDVTSIDAMIQSQIDEDTLWSTYMQWDGMNILKHEFEMQDGRWLACEFKRNDDGLYDLLAFRDISETHHLVDAYEERLKAAAQESQSKTSFLARMSHEIRTPMNGIMGMLSLAKTKVEATHPVMQYLTKADELSDHMLSLLNDILDMSRIEAGKVELEEKPFSLHALGTRLYDMFSKNLEARGIQYTINYENMTEDCVIGDQLRISQIIINFLSNAVKFTEKGEIKVTFSQMLIQDNVMDLMVCVHDTGPGMSPEFISRIFRPFEQENAGIAQKYGGSGLGMAITEQLVHLMQGEIVVESMEGEGSDFYVYFHLPVAEASDVVKDEKVSEPASVSVVDEASILVHRHILLAEDNEINAMIAVEILQSMGAVVDVAKDGQMAVDCFREHPEYYYDVILMDVQMPVMDGRTAARVIRALPRKDAKATLIFALSADAYVEDEHLSVESGMNGHYAKPVDFNALRKDLGAFLK